MSKNNTIYYLAHKAKSYKILFHVWIGGEKVWATDKAEGEPFLLQDAKFLQSAITNAINAGVKPDQNWDYNRGKHHQGTKDNTKTHNRRNRSHKFNMNWHDYNNYHRYDRPPQSRGPLSPEPSVFTTNCVI